MPGQTSPASIKKSAVFSPCRRYRFALWRLWNKNSGYVMFIGLNPSTADESLDDPTLKRCIGYARSWGYGGVCMTNLFAFRSTKPNVMKSVYDPIDLENDQWLQKLASKAAVVVAAWGNHGNYRERSKAVQKLLPNLHCLTINNSGEPGHPLYQKANKRPMPFKQQH